MFLKAVFSQLFYCDGLPGTRSRDFAVQDCHSVIERPPQKPGLWLRVWIVNRFSSSRLAGLREGNRLQISQNDILSNLVVMAYLQAYRLSACRHLLTDDEGRQQD